MWRYYQPTEITFGTGSRSVLCELTARFGSTPILVTDADLITMPMIEQMRASLGPDTPVFSEITANPTVKAVDALSEFIRRCKADVVAAIGGGSTIDCSKAACSTAVQGGPVTRYTRGEAILGEGHVPLIAVPTTAGTGSEVTSIAVLDDPERGTKAPLAHSNFYPRAALVDPELTLSLPRYVTACTGLDALAHAIEGYWSRNHQPLCDLIAREAVRLVFTHLPAALDNGADLEARAGMSAAALMGGLAFQLPKNAAVHACSYPLSSLFHLPHGAACAMTLDAFIRFNAEVMGARGIVLAKEAGFMDMPAMADAVAALKKRAGLPTGLSEIGVHERDLGTLVAASFHPIIGNNPRPVTPEALLDLYRTIF